MSSNPVRERRSADASDANRAIVTLHDSDGWLRFEASDEREGFDPRTVQRGTGLRGMADRIEAIGGAQEIQSAPVRETIVTGEIPVAGSR
jgi:signal transduction histidine kinase